MGSFIHTGDLVRVAQVDPAGVAAAVTQVAGVLDESFILDAVGRAVAQASCLFASAARAAPSLVRSFAFRSFVVGGGRGGGVGAQVSNDPHGLDCPRTRRDTPIMSTFGSHVGCSLQPNVVAAGKRCPTASYGL